MGLKVEIEFFDINEVPPPETSRPLLLKVIKKGGNTEEPDTLKVGIAKFGCTVLDNGKKVFESYSIFDPLYSRFDYEEGKYLYIYPNKFYEVTHWAYFTI